MANQSSNLATFQAGRHVMGVRLSVYKGAVLASGSITATPSYPATAIAVSYSAGSEADAYRGMRVHIYTSGGALKGVTHVRFSGTISSASLPIRELSNAKISIVSGDTFELINEPMLVGKLPTADETFSPDGLAFTDQGDEPPPLAQSGGHWAGRVARGASIAEVVMQGSGTLIDPDSASALTHLWGTLPSGVAFKTGSANTDASPTLEVDPGFHVVPHTVTDPDNSKSVTQRVIFMCDNASYDYSYDVLEATVEGAEQGIGSAYSSASVTLAEGITAADAPNGALAILWADEETIGGSANIYRNWNYIRAGILFVGYIKRDEQANNTDGGDVTTLELISPMARLAEMTSYSKVMETNASPDAWGEVDSLTVWRAMAQIIQFYTSLVEAGFDYTALNPSYDLLYPALYLQKSTFYGQLIELASGVQHRIVCDRTGRFWTQLHPALMPLADRATGAETTSTYTSADVYPGYSIGRTQWESVEQTRLRGFTAGASGNQGIVTVYPGNAPGMGIDNAAYERQIVESVTTAKEIVGMYGAYNEGVFVDGDEVRSYAPSLSVTMPGVYDHFDFALTEYQAWNLSNAASLDLTDYRFYLRRWRASYAGGTCEVSADFSAATYAPPGEVEEDTGGVVVINPPVDVPPVTGTPRTPDGFYPGVPNLAGFSLENRLWYTATGNRGASLGGPDWTSVDMTAISGWPGGTFCDFTVDPFSPKYLGTGTAVNGWIVTTTHVMRVTSIGPSMAISSTSSLVASSGTTGGRCIEASRATQNFVLIISYSPATGTICHRTTNGTSWTASTVSSTIDLNYAVNGDAWNGGLFMSMTNPQLAYTSAFNTTTNGDGYRTTDGGATWSQITGSSSIPDIDPGSYGGASSIMCPILDATQSRAVYGYRVNPSTYIESFLYRAIGTTVADISPTSGGNKYGPVYNSYVSQRRNIAIADDDPNVAVLCGTYKVGSSGFQSWGLFGTRNLWSTTPTWTLIHGTVSTLDYISAYGVSANLFYITGGSGTVAAVTYSNGAWSYDDRSGDLTSTDFVVALCGL